MAAREVTKSYAVFFETFINKRVESRKDDEHPSAPSNLKWMCREIITNDLVAAEEADIWIGFIQGTMLANHMISFDKNRKMFEKTLYGGPRSIRTMG